MEQEKESARRSEERNATKEEDAEREVEDALAEKKGIEKNTQPRIPVVSSWPGVVDGRCDPLPVRVPSDVRVDVSAKAGGDGRKRRQLPAFTIEDVAEIEKYSKEDCTNIRWVGTQGQKLQRIDTIGAFSKLVTLNLRSNILKSIKGVQTLTRLTSLELYDNQVKKISYVAPLVNLKVLDLSFNKIKTIQGLDKLTRLEKLYIANNRISEIPEGAFGALKALKIIDLGANRLRSMKGLESLSEGSLEELWLGKNKITKIDHIEKLTKLVRLDVQSNRLTTVSNMPTFPELEELYLSHNAITSMDGVQRLKKLGTLDMSSNRIASITSIFDLRRLEELWINSNEIQSFDEVETLAAAKLPNLKTIYLEHCAVAEEVLYRKRVAALFPTLLQLDADLIRRPAAAVAAGSAEETTKEEAGLP